MTVSRIDRFCALENMFTFAQQSVGTLNYWGWARMLILSPPPPNISISLLPHSSWTQSPPRISIPVLPHSSWTRNCAIYKPEPGLIISTWEPKQWKLLALWFCPSTLQLKGVCVLVKPNEFCSRLLSRNWMVAREWVPEWDEERRIKFASNSEVAGGDMSEPFPGRGCQNAGWTGTMSVIMKDEISFSCLSGISGILANFMRGRAKMSKGARRRNSGGKCARHVRCSLIVDDK